MKKIVILPVKNEEWILEKCLACASVWADHIIVADQNSTDTTAEIAKKFSKVIYIKNDSQAFNEAQRRHLLLEAARNFDGNNFILNLSADEVLTYNISEPAVFEANFGRFPPGTGFAISWPQLWKSENKYRKDGSVWTNNYIACAFIDDRKSSFGGGFMHIPRIPEKISENALKVNEVKIIHYQFVDFERMLAKQRWLRILEFKNVNQHDFITSLRLNNKYFITKDEHGIHLEDVPNYWLMGYPKVSLNLKNQDWHIEPSKKLINELGPHRLKWLDIWDTNWGEKIKDPRNFLQKLYHKHQLFFSEAYANLRKLKVRKP